MTTAQPVHTMRVALSLDSTFVNYRNETSDLGMHGYEDRQEDSLTFGYTVVVGEHTMPFNVEEASKRLPLAGLRDAYEQYAEENFPPTVYKEVMEHSGVDHMVVYPTVGLYTTAVPDMDADMATAVRRAYNNWLADFCSEAGGRVYGAASIDLRDPVAAAKEVRRCVKDLGFKSVHLNPTPAGEHRLYDEICDPLWAEISDLDGPVGVHPASGNAADSMIYHYLPGLVHTQATVSFAIGGMIACAAFIGGGVLERHPKLRLVFFESGAGWVGYWLERLESSINGGYRGLGVAGLSMTPIEYFQRQCFISSDQDDPGIKTAIEAIGDDNIVTATDFSHPEGRRYGQAVEMLLALPGVSEESKRKILWDNALRLYPIDPEA